MLSWDEVMLLAWLGVGIAWWEGAVIVRVHVGFDALVEIHG